jgi:hypothetical protein
MNEIFELLKVILPAGIVLYAMYLTTKSFLNKDLEKKLLEVRGKSTEIILPNRLQAYERMCLFLERISPGNLVLRLNDKSYSAKELQGILVADIRNEFNHNLSQQLYMSDQAWTLIKNSVEQMVSLINQAAGELPEDARSVDLARKILEHNISEDNDFIGKTLSFIKAEIRQVF